MVTPSFQGKNDVGHLSAVPGSDKSPGTFLGAFCLGLPRKSFWMVNVELAMCTQ